MTRTGLKFNESTHTYWLDGKRVPGVTSLIGDGLPKPALTYWSAKTVAEFVADNPDKVDVLRDMGRGPMVSALKGVPWQKRDEAAVRGKDVHAIAERIIHGEEVDVPGHLEGFVDGYLDFLDAFHVEPVLTEFAVAHRGVWYAGTCDAIVRIGGETVGLDLKTSNRVYGSTAMQVAAYVKAEFYLNGGVEEPVPAVDWIGVAHVTEHGTRLHPFKSLDDAWDDFQSVAAVAKSVKRIEAQLLDPTPVPEEIPA